jgi:hypothetical protein
MTAGLTVTGVSTVLLPPQAARPTIITQAIAGRKKAKFIISPLF